MKMRISLLMAGGILVFLSVARAGETEVAFLRDRVSITTSSGVIGFPSGSQVTVVSRHGGTVTVKSQDQQFDVSADKLMTDSEAARKLSATDAAEQQAAHQQVAQQDAARRAAQQQAYQSAVPSDPKAALKAQLQETEKRRHELESELGRVHDAQKDAGPENQVRYTKRHTAWGHIKSISTSANAGELAAHERDLRQKIEDLKRTEQWLREK